MSPQVGLAVLKKSFSEPGSVRAVQSPIQTLKVNVALYQDFEKCDIL